MKKWLSGMLACILVATGLGIYPVQAADTGVTQIPNTTRTIRSYDDSFLDVVGFGEKQIHSRNEYIKTAQYRVVSSEREFLQAIADASSGKVHVIEIKKDLNLGYLEVGLTDQEKKTYSFFKKYEDPTDGYTNPVIQQSGVSKLDISNVDGLTIFSKTGCKIKHTELKLQKSANDLIIRNLSFDEMWQWDDTGKHKEVGWTFIKVNGATNVWIDHCSFTDAADGLIDFENGSSGVTLSWCQMGAPATTDPPKDSAIYPSIQYMEKRYTAGELGADSRYKKLRDAGASVQDIMAYAAYHSKCHLVGSGDKDYCNYVYSDGRVLKDCNAELNLTLAYNYYRNMGQRQPMIRQGVGHLINCYFDNSGHEKLQNQKAFADNGGYALSRCLNARNGASIAADTCVFQDIRQPIVGAEVQGDDTANMSEQWAKLFQNAVNHALIVNSTVSNDSGTYTGSSWDNNGNNLFTSGFQWKDKKSIGNWAWSSSIKGVENMDKSNPPSTPFEFEYATKEKLPYTYQVLPLDEVKEVIPKKAGAGMLDLSEEQWCMVRQADGSEKEPSTEVSVEPSEIQPSKPSEDTDISSVDYPLQKFRIGIGDTNRNINITGFGENSALNSWITNGEENEKWYLRYIREGVYEIINARTGKKITSRGNRCVIAEEGDNADQRWHIEGVEKDFSGNYLYYKITSEKNPDLALTFRPDGNRVMLETYTGTIYQKMKLNCDGLEGFAANCKVSEGEKAGAIGGLLGETIVVRTMEEMKAALVEKRPLTIVVSGVIDCKNENYDWRIEDDKTIVGAYDGNQLHDCKLRTNDYFGEEYPSDNIILKNLNIQIDTNKSMMALAVYSSKNIWVDHCTFHCDFEKEYDEVGKFIWVNTPYEGKDLERSPDFLTFSYNRFENRFWGIAFGTQNGVITEDRASIFYNVFDSVVQRCPQMGNGTMHVNSNYYVRNSTSIHEDGMAQIKCGENSVVYSQSNRFEGFRKEDSGYWDVEVTLDGNCQFIDHDSYTDKSEKGGGTPVPFQVDGTYNKTTWNPAEQYGFHVLSAYDVDGKNDTKAFCNTYAGAASSQSNLHYITDRDMKTFVKEAISAPFLQQPTLTDQPLEEPSRTEEISQPQSSTGSWTVSESSDTSRANETTKADVVSRAESSGRPGEASDSTGVSRPGKATEPGGTDQTSKAEVVSRPDGATQPGKTSWPNAAGSSGVSSRPSEPDETSRTENGSKPSEPSKSGMVESSNKPSEPSKSSMVESSSKPSEPGSGSNLGGSGKNSEPDTVSPSKSESRPSHAGQPSEPGEPEQPSRTDHGSRPSEWNPQPSDVAKPSMGSQPSVDHKPSDTVQPTSPEEPSRVEPKKVQSIALKTSVTLKKKQKYNVTVRIKPIDAANPSISVKSLDPSIVKVVKKSNTVLQFQAKKAGITRITVATKDGSKITKKLLVKVRPDTVEKLKASPAKGGKVTLTWKKQTKVTGYKIECYDTKSKKWKKVTIKKKNKVTITKAKGKTSYRFRVSSYIKSGKDTVYGNTSKVIKVSMKK